jgi:serine kinase of HPr protein (carbohydrate metabolism regulator)
MMVSGFRLVADDRVVAWTSGGRLFGRSPEPLAGLLEARGVGIIPAPPLQLCEIALLVVCRRAPAEVERMPESEPEVIEGVAVPRIELWPFEAAGPAKLRRALEHLGASA